MVYCTFLDLSYKYLPLPAPPVGRDLCILVADSFFTVTLFSSSGFVMKAPVQIKPIFSMPGQEMLPQRDSPKVSNKVFVEKHFIVVLRSRCKWDSGEIVS